MFCPNENLSTGGFGASGLIVGPDPTSLPNVEAKSLLPTGAGAGLAAGVAEAIEGSEEPEVLEAAASGVLPIVGVAFGVDDEANLVLKDLPPKLKFD